MNLLNIKRFIGAEKSGINDKIVSVAVQFTDGTFGRIDINPKNDDIHYLSRDIYFYFATRTGYYADEVPKAIQEKCKNIVNGENVVENPLTGCSGIRINRYLSDLRYKREVDLENEEDMGSIKAYRSKHNLWFDGIQY